MLSYWKLIYFFIYECKGIKYNGGNLYSNNLYNDKVPKYNCYILILYIIIYIMIKFQNIIIEY